MKSQLRRVLTALVGAWMLAGPAAGADVPALKSGTQLARVLSHAPVVTRLHKMAAREGLALSRVTQRETGAATVITFHARPVEGGAEAPRFAAHVQSDGILIVEAPGPAAAK